MRRTNAPAAAPSGHDSAASRFLAALPALLLAQLLFAGVAAGRALTGSDGGFSVLALAVGNQLLFLLRALPLLFLLSWPLLRVQKQTLRLGLLAALWSLFIALEFALEQYFLTARVALGADLFGYRLDEIRTTVGGAAEGGFGIGAWLNLVLPLVLLWAGIYWNKWKVVASAWVLGVLLAAGIGAWLLPAAVGVQGLRSESARLVATSKGAFFVADTLRYWRSAPATIAAPSPALSSSDAKTATEKQLDPRYPFWHEETTPDTLGPYFSATQNGQPPNIVLIVVEGLGRSFSGPDATLGSFTPFLDQLAGQSLYFDNFMANQGRTFGVLPSLLGSLPVAEQGFAELGPKMPAHVGLFNVLHRQGYHSTFYLGTDSKFDNERGYLQLQEINKIVDLRNFGSGYQKNPFSEWGYPDRELVSRVLADNANQQTPFVQGIQTISMHTAYEFPGQAEYKQRVEQRLDALGIPAIRKFEYRAHVDIYSAILYTDDQLRRYFESVKKTAWYPNTIFIVTGDHRLAELPQDTHIERYHVPLLIYSSLLKKPARIKAVSSHVDVTPSLLALLAHTYGLKRPERVTWVGTGLDMATHFQSTHSFVLKQTKTSVPDFVDGRWFLHDGQLFELGDGIRASAVDDRSTLDKVQQHFVRYQADNASFLQRLALSPDGATPPLVAFNSAVEAPPSVDSLALAAQPPGLALEEVKLERTGRNAAQIVATYVNGDNAASRIFTPLAVLTGGDGRELGEGYGTSIQLNAHERREVLFSITLPSLSPGRYFVSVLASDPDSGKSFGRGRYHIPLDIAEAVQ